MKPRRSRLRPVTTLALTLGLMLAGAACERGGGTNTPGGGKDAESGGKNGGTSSPTVDGGKDYVYPSEGFVLTATTTIKFEISGPQGAGGAEVSARSLIEATPEGDKLKLHGKVLELIGYKGSGQLDPEFMKKQAAEQGQTDFDLIAELGKSESWMIVDHKGEVDKAATNALAENKASEGQSFDFGLFNIPDLPSIDLVQGEKITLATATVERATAVGMIPAEVDETWMLRKIDENRVAEFQVDIEASGADALTLGGQSANVSMLEESSYTILFNLDSKLPIAVTGYSQSEMQIDIEGQPESMQVSSNSEISSTYEPGAAAAATE